MKKNNFGIKMKQWCREHEKTVVEAVEQKQVTPELLAMHKEKIAWVQHERLVHLIVTVMVVFGELFFVGVAVFRSSIIAAIVMILLAVLLGFYFYHYFFLENSVQRWYKLSEEMQKILENSDPATSAEKGQSHSEKATAEMTGEAPKES